MKDRLLAILSDEDPDLHIPQNRKAKLARRFVAHVIANPLSKPKAALDLDRAIEQCKRGNRGIDTPLMVLAATAWSYRHDYLRLVAVLCQDIAQRQNFPRNEPEWQLAETLKVALPNDPTP